MNEYNDYLIHFGVKGMKWGVRKDKYKSADKATRKKYRDEYKKTDEYKKKVNTAKKVGAGVIAGALTLVGGYALAETISYSTTGRSLIDNITNKSNSGVSVSYNSKTGNVDLNGKSIVDVAAAQGHYIVEDTYKKGPQDPLSEYFREASHQSINDIQENVKKRKK